MDKLGYANSLKGQVYVNINGQGSPYVRTFKGLRQGDPLDTLGALLDKAVAKHHIGGCYPR